MGTDLVRVYHLGVLPAKQVNSALHPFGVANTGTSLAGIEKECQICRGGM